MARLASLSFAVLALVACKEKNPQFCEGHPTDPRCVDDGDVDAGIDAITSCTNSDQCTDPDLGVCDPTSGGCVECTATETAACTGTSPVCGADHECRGCQRDDECESEACDLGTGACFEEGNVIYLSTTGAAGPCTQASPCQTFAQGLAQVAGPRNVIKAAEGAYSGQAIIDNVTVTILGEGATLAPVAINQSVVVVANGANVTIDGLTIQSGGGTGAGIQCSPGAGSSPTVRLRRSIVRGNAGGGVSLSSCSFELTNNWITGNGSGTGLFGGVKVDSVAVAGTYRIDFNTIFNNNANDSFAAGIICTSVAQALTFSNNIIFANESTDQVAGTMCSFTYSDIGPAAAAGTGNISSAPTFVDADNGDLHLDDGSAGIDVADPDATLAVDIDGDVRPQGAVRDMGADEVVP